MTIKISLVRALPNKHWGELHFPNRKPLDWHLDLAYLLYMWEIGEDTILETTFYEIFDQDIKFPHLPLYMLE